MTSWNEIRKAATAFSKRWRSAHDEKSQAQSFLKEFFNVFGVDAVAVATFEHRIKFADGSQGYVDCFWQGKILVEMKSRGRDLDAAYRQAMDYVRSLPNIAETPRAIVVSDFARIRFYDLSRDCALTEFPLKDLRKYVTLFGYLIGSDGSEEIREQDPVNRKAAEKMAALHDAMKVVGYEGHPLEVYLVRLLFCLFAEDTGIFKPGQFSHFIKTRTAEDGSDLAPQLALLFDTLNREKRLVNLDETIAAFPYVNGGLFADTLPFAAFSSEMRQALLACAALDWSNISPAIFGAMFQGVMDEKARHDLGAHYTSEENILKLIRPLFLDDLRAEFDALCALKSNAKRSRLQAFHDKLAALAFLDPACGCGNFLLIAYRELRRLEMDVLEELHKDDPSLHLDISVLCQVSVAQFHGIEIEPFPAEIAKVALWLMDHLCNMEVADRLGQYFVRIPIKDAPHILCANALTMDWGSLLAAKGKQRGFDYIMGNPPFLGFTWMSPAQKADMLALFPGIKNLDFVCGWYKKASDLIQGSGTRCAFVSTNSITQGEQVAPLWSNLNAERDFAYRTFKWHNEAKGNAAVHCVIIGFHSKSLVASA
ncbi:MAG: DNA methyltransferase, partial [Kiritimatiellia bacterium]